MTSTAEELAEHLRLALDAGRLGTWRWDMRTGVTVWDSRMEELFGLAPGSFDGNYDGWIRLLHPDDVDTSVQTLQTALAAGGGSYQVRHRVILPDGGLRWIEGSGRVLTDESGNPVGAIGCSRDITDEVVRDQERQRLIEVAFRSADQERVNRSRLEFLTRINDELAEATDRRDIMRRVTRAAVPRLGDWCRIAVFADPDSPAPEFELAHVDPMAETYAEQVVQAYGYDPQAPTGIPRVIRTGEAEFTPRISPEMLHAPQVSERDRRIATEFQLLSTMTVPLVKGEAVLGAMQFLMSAAGRPYTEEDLALAVAAAGRIASSLENRRLAEQQRWVAETLQANLLPRELPEIPGLELAVRYWAAGEASEVGGDFYDAFRLDSGRWATVIGDVCGTGPVAAALTGLARHSIRMSAWHGDGPEQVLRWLNRAIGDAAGEAFCTALYAQLSPLAERGFRLDLACGGHPLPVLARADGGTAPVGRPGTLLGLFDTIELDPVTEVLAPGDTLVLYTDGVTDVPPPHGLEDERLTAIVAEAASGDRSADEVADRIRQALEAVLPLPQRNDDIALLVLRVAR